MSFPDFTFQGYPITHWMTRPELLWQPLLVLVSLLIAHYFIARRITGILPEPSLGLKRWLRGNITFILLFVFLSLGVGIGQFISAPLHFIQMVWALVGLWLLVVFPAAYFQDRITARTVAILVYPFVALGLLGDFKSAIEFLDDLTLDSISARLSALQIIIGIFVLVAALWVSLVVSRWLGNRIDASKALNPSLKVLLSKILRIFLVTIAVLISINAMGLDLTVFAFLGGGIGIGIGFGLQKVISNLVCGFILLGDKSIKPGDVVQIGGTYAGGPEPGGIYGWINSLRARYTSVITRDGTEHLIPNEDLITQPVINWSFTHERVRLHVIFYISYRADVHRAIALVNEAARSIERVVDDPKPKCLLVDFSNSALKLEARFWIRDPASGVTAVKSAVRLAGWDLFQKHGIQVPFPQRDLHIKPPANIEVTLHKSEKDA